ncbi:DUF7079 family protein [Methylocucumis oryzae]|uniref:DUF7079 family protein n=1 Tax=Methylocucumis oryzae TaxID=1632867 RepID=UPI00104054E4|nr:hypothetical protein [Methylocucumis oryzae]
MRGHTTSTIPLAHADLAAREPVWEALSELFLDTDTALSRCCRAEQLAMSPYSIAQLEIILVEEVYPVCKHNLCSVAGEWAGFNQEWLKTKILGRLSSAPRTFHVLNLDYLIVKAWAEWRATKKDVLALRNV